MIDTVNSPYIHTGTSDNFKALVLENSHRGPVLVNFCSKKSDPCLQQYPILDQLIHHYAGRLLLINVDTESEFVVTKEYGIASVPTLKLFRNELVVETLHDFQSEADLKKIIEEYVTRESDLKLADAIEMFTSGNARAAYETIAELIVDDPVNPRLPLTLCKLLKHEGRYEEAIKLIESLPTDIRANSEVQQFYILLGFFNELDPTTDMARLKQQSVAVKDDLAVKRKFVTALVTEQQFEEALQLLVEIMEMDPGYQENYAQQAMLKIFAIVGTDDPLVDIFGPNLRRYVH